MSIYKPASGRGFIWGIGLLVFVMAIMFVPIIINVTSGLANPGFIGVMGLLAVLVGGMFVYFTWAARTIEYVLDDKEVVIKWAFNKKNVPLDSIKGVRMAVGTSSFKVVGASWPGFHLGSFTDPGGHGTVNMFGTRLWGTMVLIRTKWEIIGITPAEPERFLEELHSLVPGLAADGFTGDVEVAPHSPWRDRFFNSPVALAGLVFAGAASYLKYRLPTLPPNIPMHYNIAGQVDRYGSPRELLVVLGVGVVMDVLMIGVTTLLVRNNKTSARMMAWTGLMIAVIFSAIAVSMALFV